MLIPRLLALLLLSIFFCTTTSSLATSTRSFAYPNHHVTRDYDSFDDNKNLVYAYCANAELQRECSVVREQNVFDAKHSRNKSSCNVTLKAEGENNVVDKYFLGVARFGDDRAILQWQIKRDPGIRGAQNAEKYYKLSIVDFTSCKVRQVGVVVKEYDLLHGLLTQTNLLTYDDGTFDVVYPNRELCSGGKVCKQTFDAEGKPVGGDNKVVAWFKHDSLFVPILPIERRSRRLGHAIMEMHRQEKIVSLARGDEVKLLQKMPHVNFSSTHSVSHQLIGVCSKESEKSLKCRQFDARGVLKLEKSLEFDYPMRFFMHNLPKGGFLLLVERLIDCPAEDKECNNANDNEHRAIEYDAQGKEIGTVKFAGLDCADKKMVQWKKLFDVAKDGKYCVANMCLYDFRTPGNRERFDLTTKCFTDKDLGKSFSFSSLFG